MQQRQAAVHIQFFKFLSICKNAHTRHSRAATAAARRLSQRRLEVRRGSSWNAATGAGHTSQHVDEASHVHPLYKSYPTHNMAIAATRMCPPSRPSQARRKYGALITCISHSQKGRTTVHRCLETKTLLTCTCRDWLVSDYLS